MKAFPLKQNLQRLGLVLVSGGLALWAAWPWLHRRGTTGEVELRRVGELPSPFAPGPPARPDERLVRIPPDWPRSGPTFAQLRERVFTPLVEEDARLLFAMDDGYSRFDPFCGFVYRPHIERTLEMKEHPLDRWVLRTNAHGMRRDTEVSAKHPDLRVLVAGDSHVDGVCNNDENLCSLLEAELGRDGRTVEVLNAAKGGYSFFNYLGVLRRYLELRPDVFVVVVNGGNDFLEVLSTHAWFTGLPGPSGSEPYWPQVERAIKLRKAALPQTLLSLKYFAYRPEELPIALEAAQQMVGFVQQLCLEHGVRLIVAYLPPVTDVEPEHFGLPLPELCAALELGPEDLGSTERLAGLLIAWLAAREVEVLDLRPAFRASSESLYWAGDLHIDLASHRLIARELAALLR